MVNNSHSDAGGTDGDSNSDNNSDSTSNDGAVVMKTDNITVA